MKVIIPQPDSFLVHRRSSRRMAEPVRAFAVTGMLLFILAAPAFAGFDEGVAAFDRGDYSTAYRELLPLAEQGHRERLELRIGGRLRRLFGRKMHCGFRRFFQGTQAHFP